MIRGMSYAQFQELCEACYVTKEALEDKYNADPTHPWSPGTGDYTPDLRQRDAGNFLNEVFGEDDELDLSELSLRIKAYRERMQSEHPKGPIWSTIGNIRVATSKAAADALRLYMDVLSEAPELTLEEIRTQGKPTPYGEMRFATFVKKLDGSITPDGAHPADYEAAGTMYDGDLLALLIAREYDIEDYLP